MAAIFRFVDDAHLTVRLNLNDGTIWALGRGLDIGISTVEKLYLTQPPVDGAVLADSFRPVVTMQVPLLLYPEGGATPANLRDAWDDLAAELDRKTNNIEWRGTGDTVSYFWRTYRANIPSMHRELITPSPMYMKRGGPQFTVEIDREPVATGAGGFI
jgi:hypothetical protein